MIALVSPIGTKKTYFGGLGPWTSLHNSFHTNDLHNELFPCSLNRLHESFKDVRANCFCASFLRTQIRMPRHS